MHRFRAGLALAAIAAAGGGCDEPCGPTNPDRCSAGEECVSIDGGPGECAPYCGDAGSCADSRVCRDLTIIDTAFRVTAFVCVDE